MQKHKVEAWTSMGMFALALGGCGSALPQEEATESSGQTSEALVPAAPDCTSTEMTEILRPPTSSSEASVRVACNFTFPSNPQSFMPAGVTFPGKITRVVEFGRDSSGKDAVGVKFMCRNAHLHPTFDAFADGRAISVRSVDTGAGWSIPHHVSIENCYVEGNIRIMGADESRACDSTLDSRCSPDPSQVLIERRQATAPHHIFMFSLDVTARIGAHESNEIEFDKGVTYSTLTGSVLHGSLGKNTAIYLAPESAHNSIVSNYIHVASENREQIAIDGSANNYIADNDFSELDHGGVYIFRNCGEGGTVRIQKPWNNAIVNNRFYYERFDGSGYKAINVASRTAWMAPNPRLGQSGYLYNTSSYCDKDSSIRYGSGIDDFDNAAFTTVAQNQIRQGQHQLTVSGMIKPPNSHDLGSQPYYAGNDNVAVAEFTQPLTYTAQAAAEPPVNNSLYMVQGRYLLRTDDESGVYVTLTHANWSRTTSMAAVGGKLYIVQAGGLYCADPATAELCRTFPGTWDGPTTMTAIGTKLFITQDDSLWAVDTTTGSFTRLGSAGSFSGVTSMVGRGTAFGNILYFIQDGNLSSFNVLFSLVPKKISPRAEWGGPTSMAFLAGKLYIVQDNGLWTIDDLATGTYSRVGTADWSGATSMTAMNGSLFITQDSQLWSVDPASGALTLLPSPRGDWAGPISMTAMP